MQVYITDKQLHFMKRLTVIVLIFICFLNINFCIGQIIAEKKIAIGQDTISYYDNGFGKSTLLFIHGSFIDKEYWKKQLLYFSPQYRIIAIDLVGHGKSTQNRSIYSIKEYGNDISFLIKKLSLKNVILIGHSIGADIMLEVVANNNKNITGIIGIDYFKNVGFQISDTTIRQIMFSLKNDFINTNAAYATRSLLTSKTDSSISKRVISDFKAISPKVGIPLNEDFFYYTKREETLLKSLKVKLYLINVDYYPTNENSLKKYLGNNYEIKYIKGTSHFPMIENSKEFNSLLRDLVMEIVKK